MPDDPSTPAPDPSSRAPDAVVVAVFTADHQAELAAGLLKAQHIPCWLHTDDCGGMLSVLDPVHGVRLLVLPEHAAEARSILSALPSPTVLPPDMETKAAPPVSLRPRFSLLQLSTGIVIGVLLCLLYQRMARWGTKTHEYDTNQDGKTDAYYVYRDGYLVEESYDRNHDGRRDWWFYYETRGKRTAWKADDNFDGVVDATYIYTNNVLVSSQLDTDFNTIPDVNYTYAYDLATQADWRPNGTNAVTLRQFFKHGVLTEEWRDTNADGAFDVTVRYDAFLNAVATNAYAPKLLSSPSR